MKQLIKLGILKLGKIIYNNDDSKIIFYHDVHSDKKYTDMSTPMELFKEHIKIIKENGFEIVPKITKKKNQIMITFDDGFKGLYDNFDYFIQNNAAFCSRSFAPCFESFRCSIYSHFYVLLRRVCCFCHNFSSSEMRSKVFNSQMEVSHKGGK